MISRRSAPGLTPRRQARRFGRLFHQSSKSGTLNRATVDIANKPSAQRQAPLALESVSKVIKHGLFEARSRMTDAPSGRRVRSGWWSRNHLQAVNTAASRQRLINPDRVRDGRNDGRLHSRSRPRHCNQQCRRAIFQLLRALGR
jgi:hypothetical protein